MINSQIRNSESRKTIDFTLKVLNRVEFVRAWDFIHFKTLKMSGIGAE